MDKNKDIDERHFELTKKCVRCGFHFLYFHRLIHAYFSQILILIIKSHLFFFNIDRYIKLHIQ